jgi:RNA polymerase sigma-70 factor (ECF subfamily)
MDHARDPQPEKGTARAAVSVGDDLVALWHQGGDREEIFHRLFRAYYRAVKQFFERREGLDVEASVQETFLRVHRGLPEFRGDSSFQTWLFLIAANVLRNQQRGRTTQKRAAAEVPLEAVAGAAEAAGSGPRWYDADDSPLDRVLADERVQVLRVALQSLPPQMRRCVLLRLDQQLKYREIAVRLGISVETVKAHLFQARQQLRDRLGSYFEDVLHER